ncbi:polysaccharide biosynthesis protein [Nonomuraea sp. H19]|uniref:polysaccharide biosynthesis protein n=1 Tax=Nonomuraea sp. H19 TaxID=3452206 RepID=UPI003F88D98F
MLLDEAVGITETRAFCIPSDILGRNPIDTHVPSNAGYLSGKRVLVTGAGGSIGSELCRQLHRLGQSQLVMLDHDDSALHAVSLSISGRGTHDGSGLVLTDIRDSDSLMSVFVKYQPQVVFHVAALKHLPMLERFPHEAWKTNVLGTLNVLAAAEVVGVERFINISTDKAANPTSVLGVSKRLAERLTAWKARNAVCGAHVSVRFGNVLGSRGSVLHAFTAQISAGGPVRVTHPDVTRFLMTIHEACRLVIHAGAIVRNGEGVALVLDVGKPVRIADIARQMIEASGKPIEIVYTGLQPGEKLHEDLLGKDERDERPSHPLIIQVAVPPMAPDELDPIAWYLSDELPELVCHT